MTNWWFWIGDWCFSKPPIDDKNINWWFLKTPITNQKSPFVHFITNCGFLLSVLYYIVLIKWSSTLSFISKGSWQKVHIGLCTGSSKSVHEDMFMGPVNYSFLLKLLRQIRQLPNLPHDVNSIVLRALSYVLTVCWQ